MAIKKVTVEINGRTAELTYSDSSSKWTGTMMTPPRSSWSQSDHKFNVKITATNDAGTITTIDGTDSTFGDILKLRVIERQAPVITITSPSAGSYITTATPTIKGTIADNTLTENGDSGVNKDSIVVKIDSTDVTAKIKAASGGLGLSDGSNGVVNFSFPVPSALSDGSHTITIDCKDNDENAAKQATVTFKIDTVPPTLEVTAPVDETTTSEQQITVTGTTNDTTSKPVTIKIKVGSTDQGTVTVQSSGAFSKEVTLQEGENIITVTATDTAGKSAEVTRTVYLDTTIPTFTSVVLTPNPADVGNTLTITVEVTSE